MQFNYKVKWSSNWLVKNIYTKGDKIISHHFCNGLFTLTGFIQKDNICELLIPNLTVSFEKIPIVKLITKIITKSR